MAFIKIVLFAVIIMVLVILGLAIQILFTKRGKFPNIHIGSNPYMKAHGVTCAQTYDKMEQAKVRQELRFKELSLKESGEEGHSVKGFR